MFDHADKLDSKCNQSKNIKPPSESVRCLHPSGNPAEKALGGPFYPMKWFKHESSALKDEKIQDLIYKYGMEGYGFYFALVELVAEKLDEKLDPKVSISWHYFRRIMRISKRKSTEILLFLHQISLISCNIDDEKVIIEIPKLLHRIDNWTKRSVVTTEQVSTNKNKNKNKNIEREREEHLRFAPPTMAEAFDYFKELLKPQEAEKFFDYFTANGWKVGGRAPMKDWRAAARNWVRSPYANNQKDAQTIRREKVARELKSLEVNHGIKKFAKGDGTFNGIFPQTGV